MESLNEQQLIDMIKSFDSGVDQATINKYKKVCQAYGIRDLSQLNNCLISLQLANDNDDTTWLGKEKSFKEIREYFEKLTINHTPIKGNTISAGPTPSKFEKDFNTRAQRGKVDQSHGDSSEFYNLKRTQVNITVEEHNFQSKTKFLQANNKIEIVRINLMLFLKRGNDPVKVRKDVLIQRLEKMSKLYEQYFKEMGIEYFNPFTSLNHFVSDSHDVFCIGRIVPGESGQILMDKNVGFECFDSSSKGAKYCNLDVENAMQIRYTEGKLDQTKECTFFPSQIVVVEGKYFKQNNTFQCKNIYLDNYSEDIIFSEKQVNNGGDDSFYQIMAASGPFIFPDTFDCTPLKDFLNRVADEQPEIVIISGPFLPDNFEFIKSGEIEVTDSKTHNTAYLSYDEAQHFLMDHITSAAKSLQGVTSFFVLPSVQDTNHYYPFPQPPFDYHSFNLNDKSKKGIKMLNEKKLVNMVSNPSKITINGEFNICVSSCDFLLDLMKNQYIKDNKSNKFASCLSETLNQRSIYPVYPTQVGTNLADIDAFTFDQIPDLVLYSSNLPSGIKILKDTVFVNEGQLFKNQDGGTYARIFVSNNVQKRNNERIVVEVKKL